MLFFLKIEINENAKKRVNMMKVSENHVKWPYMTDELNVIYNTKSVSRSRREQDDTHATFGSVRFF